MPARKGAARRRKFKKWALEVWSFAKGYLSFSKLLVYAVLYIDYKSTMTTARPLPDFRSQQLHRLAPIFDRPYRLFTGRDRYRALVLAQ